MNPAGSSSYHSGMASLAPPAAPAVSRPGSILLVALVLLLAWQLAYWTWIFAAPRTVVSAEPQGGAADVAVAARLFGGSSPVTTATGPAASASSLRLKGVVAPTPGRTASAIFNSGSGRDLAVFLEGDVQPGVKLVEVLPGAVVVARGGIRERIELEVHRGAVASRGPAGRPTGFRVNVARSGGNQFTFSRRELDEALKDPAQLAYLGRIGVVPQLGVRLEEAPAGSLAQKLGLQPGDVIRKVNGQPVASTGDLARIYTQFSLLTSIQAEVLRGGSTVQLSYAVQP